MKTTELKNGKWYKSTSSDYQRCILRYSDDGQILGYWRGDWGIWAFLFDKGNHTVTEATYEDLEALGTAHQEYYKPEDFETVVIPEGEYVVRVKGKEQAEMTMAYFGYISPTWWEIVIRHQPEYEDEFFDISSKTTSTSTSFCETGWFENVPVIMFEDFARIKGLGGVQVSGGQGLVDDEPKVRVFEGGSKRDDDTNKPLVNHLDPYLRLRFGYLLRAGANKYDKGNWKKLQPAETALESLHRHLAKYELNLQNGVEQDEDHLSSIIFNTMLLMKLDEKEGVPFDHFYGTMK